MRMTKQEQIDMARAWQQQQMMNNGCGTPFYAIIIVAIVMMFSSCATKTKIEYRDREVVKYNTSYVYDTTFLEKHDSVYHTIFQNGDTVYDTKYVERTRWRDNIVVKKDTCWRDSVVTIKKETVKEVTKIPKLFWISMCFSILVIIFAFVKLFRWLQIH